MWRIVIWISIKKNWLHSRLQNLEDIILVHLTQCTIKVIKGHHFLFILKTCKESSGQGSALHAKMLPCKRNENWCKSALKHTKCANISICRPSMCFFVLSVNIYATEVLFCFKFELHRAQSHWFDSKTKQKHWLVTTWYFCHSCHLVHNTHWHRLPNTKWHCSWPFFHHFEILIFHKPDHNSTVKLLWNISHSISIARTNDAYLLHVPFLDRVEEDSLVVLCIFVHTVLCPQPLYI